jgi:hypothetical protein
MLEFQCTNYYSILLSRMLREAHAGAARRCTKRHSRPYAQPGPLPVAARGQLELFVDTFTSRHRRRGTRNGTVGHEPAGGDS